MTREEMDDFEGVSADAKGANGGPRGFFNLSRGQRWVSAGLAGVIAFAVWWAGQRWDGPLPWIGNRGAALAGSTSRGFDLTTSLIPKDEILRGGPPKDGIPALTGPKILTGADANYLRPEDRVIGVVVGGKARAYPLRILIWHENVNDTLGRKAIAVSYCPLCDSAMVFGRRIGGRVLEFGISGRLYNSNVLLFNRQRKGKGESLWSQLQMRAVTGPAAKKGLKLTPLPMELTSWKDWKDRYPDTTVLSDDTGHGRDYRRSPYAGYFRTDELMFPVHPMPNPKQGMKNKDKVVVVRIGGMEKVYPVKAVSKSAGERGWIEEMLGGQQLRLIYLPDSDSVRVEAVGAKTPPALVYTFWFAWNAMHPGSTVFQP